MIRSSRTKFSKWPRRRSDVPEWGVVVRDRHVSWSRPLTDTYRQALFPNLRECRFRSNRCIHLKCPAMCAYAFIRRAGTQGHCPAQDRRLRLRPSTRDPDAQLPHTELESRTLHAQSRRGAFGTSDDPLRLFEGLEDLVALGLTERVAQCARRLDRFRDRGTRRMGLEVGDRPPTRS